MATIEKIHNKLSTVFPENQAQVLTEVIWESKEDLATKSDFSELKGVVKELATSVSDLAEAQERTELRVEELAAAQNRTELRVEELAAAQNRTELRVEELAAAQNRTELRVEELAEAQNRTEHRLDSLTLSVENLAKAQERTEIAMGNLARQVGGLSEAFGGTLEDYALDLVPEVLENHWNLKTEEAYRKEFFHQGKRFEIDLIIRGKIGEKSILVLGEVKSNLTKREVDKFLKIVEELKNAQPEELQSSEVRILFFGYRANNEAMQMVRENNCYMVSTRGKIL